LEEESAVNDALSVLRELVAVKELREEYSRRKQRRSHWLKRDPDEVRAVSDLLHEYKVREFRAFNAARTILNEIRS
jgi:hypothetical protein